MIQQSQQSKKPPEAMILNLINYHILLFILWCDIDYREKRRAAKKVERNQSRIHVCNWKIVLGNESLFKVQIRQAFPLFTSTLHSVASMNCRSWRWKDSMLYLQSATFSSLTSCILCTDSKWHLLEGIVKPHLLARDLYILYRNLQV